MDDTTRSTDAPDLIDAVSAALYLDVPPRYLARLAARRLVPHYRLPDGAVMYCRRELAAWLATCRVPAEVPADE